MTVKVIADSSHDMDQILIDRYGLDVEVVPFKLYLNGEEYVDNESLDVYKFIDMMVASPVLPKSACPSPNDFMDCLEKGVDNYMVTISSQLSGTYNAAVLAKNMFVEEFKDEFVHVFDSKSASIGETLISLKILELNGKGVVREDLILQVEDYIKSMRTFFVSESLDNLMKNGRISRFKGMIATALQIKPVMGANDDGEIYAIEKVRGSAKAFMRLAEMIAENAKSCEERILAISHVNNLERAEWLKLEVEKLCNFKDIIIVQTKGLSSLYCDNKGIIVAF